MRRAKAAKACPLCGATLVHKGQDCPNPACGDYYRRGSAEGKRIQELEVENWNLRYPVGTAVNVRMDSGEVRRTVTRSKAQMLSGHTAVVWLEGISGCYNLSHVSPAEEVQHAAR